MKKLKTTFNVLVAFAIVLGLFAFTPQYYISGFCISETGSSGGTCTSVFNKKIDEINGSVYYRDSTPGVICDANDTCTELVILSWN